MNFPKSRSRSDAFTLVELLVVIAILSILISVLLPFLGRAREYANRIKCAANLHSMGQALTMYTQQYRYYPGAAFQDVKGLNDSQAAAIWPTRLRAFMGRSRQAFYCPSQDERGRWTDRSPA